MSLHSRSVTRDGAPCTRSDRSTTVRSPRENKWWKGRLPFFRRRSAEITVDVDWAVNRGGAQDVLDEFVSLSLVGRHPDDSTTSRTPLVGVAAVLELEERAERVNQPRPKIAARPSAALG